MCLQYFAGFFDTSVGAKTETDSYKAVVGEMDVQASDVLYLTDVARGKPSVCSVYIKNNCYIFFVLNACRSCPCCRGWPQGVPSRA